MSCFGIERGKILWLLGQSGAGKTTLCTAVYTELEQQGKRVRLLDGDVLRNGLCSDLRFSPEARMENSRRVAHVANMFAEEGFTVLVALICPQEATRQVVRAILPDHFQVFIDAPLSVCEQRDPKGLYKQARAGLLLGFTGIDQAFESPSAPDLVCRTHQETVQESCSKILALLGESSQNSASSKQESTDRRRTIAVDFDGVIANYDGWRGETVFGSPRCDVREALSSLQNEGWKIVVHTARPSSSIRHYLLHAQIPFDEINVNSDYTSQSPKPVATVYWDDRAVCYSGNAMDDLEKIREFRTWTERR